MQACGLPRPTGLTPLKTILQAPLHTRASPLIPRHGVGGLTKPPIRPPKWRQESFCKTRQKIRMASCFVPRSPSPQCLCGFSCHRSLFFCSGYRISLRKAKGRGKTIQRVQKTEGETEEREQEGGRQGGRRESYCTRKDEGDGRTPALGTRRGRVDG